MSGDSERSPQRLEEDGEILVTEGVGTLKEVTVINAVSETTQGNTNH